MNSTLEQNKTSSVPWLAAWVIASAIGVVAGFLATLPLLWRVGEDFQSSIGQVPALILGGAVFGFGMGLAIGFAQWILLRGQREAVRWLIGSIAGGIVAGILAIGVSSQNDSGANAFVTTIAFALLGAILGLGQFLAARSIVRNPLWILVSALGLALGTLNLFGVGNLEIVGVGLGALAYGIITAAGMWRFSRQ